MLLLVRERWENWCSCHFIALTKPDKTFALTNKTHWSPAFLPCRHVLGEDYPGPYASTSLLEIKFRKYQDPYCTSYQTSIKSLVHPLQSSCNNLWMLSKLSLCGYLFQLLVNFSVHPFACELVNKKIGSLDFFYRSKTLISIQPLYRFFKWALHSNRVANHATNLFELHEVSITMDESIRKLESQLATQSTF